MEINGHKLTANGLFRPNDDPADPDKRQIELAAEWIKRFTTEYNGTCDESSYALKHAVERWYQEQGTPEYISNGAFIAAALLAGYVVKESTSLNCYFNFRVRKTPRYDA